MSLSFLKSFALALGVCVALVNSHGAELRTAENEYYKMITLPTPEGVVLEAGAIQVMPNGQVGVSTRWGDIYMIDGAFEDPPAHVKYNLFASGLHEVLGLTYRDGAFYATQRGEVTRMKDTNGDGRADVFESVAGPWGLSGDYHEYAFGSKFDKDGYIWVVLCLTGSFTSEAPYRGWAFRVKPDGTAIPSCSGLRSPGGIGTNALGDMFFTDNQGPWNGTCELKQLVPGAFMGHPGGNIWYKLTDALEPRPLDPVSGSRFHIEARRIPQYIPPVILFPYNKMGQSASGIACDGSNGKFGPFKDQLYVGDQTHSTVMRVFLEKVNGRYQGACFPFREGFDSGNLSLEFAPDGSLFVGGTDRGWGARGGKPFALQRLVWTGKTPFEINEIRALPDGFEFTFTEPVDPATVEQIGSYDIETYTYIYQASYGSPEVDRTKPGIRGVTTSADHKSARMIIDGLEIGHVHEIHFKGVRSVNGKPLLHPVAYYTLNAIPKKI